MPIAAADAIIGVSITRGAKVGKKWSRK